MEGNRCSFCNSTNLRWDYKNGIIVCENCGSVIEDIIFDEQPVFFNANNFKPLKYKEKKLEKILAQKNKDVSRFFLSKNNSQFNDLFKTYLNQILEKDENLKRTYDKLLKNGILSGKKAKTRIILTIYFSNDDRYKQYLRYIGITDKEYKSIISEIKTKNRIAIMNIINE
ncbi:TFIIB-type zinc ribbon-containing protein [Sulfuracidifex metallicus]|uniref:TFIIB-type domain-containing protein n=1 Tax=Sulfuracidifex metallicus DSM 6482 = JCM 9184 TaxID=523847 RepID=A0A6A9QIW8_SULME|nr:TFIIB-type zinc ribbon-containing protein [Sulfuracidifex metallicus]MUN28614.1 hypothetical protein [Sulfuracidifex metallicus DSM 6482 = JCM 9184]WOE50856.1 TFIIB-type zinc ribbon-containing protein [Sulfuracidifex metallicus DSM 6482 = JCM 9184]